MTRKMMICWIFQSTLPHGERHSPILSPVQKPNFNPRSHTGSDPCRYCGSNRQQQFQSTLPHGERRKLIFMIRMFTNFNPRSHTGSDKMEKMSADTYMISIHAPTRGATRHGAADLQVNGFQSTLPHGERLLPPFRMYPVYNFNPRSHTGSDDL